MIHSHPEVFKWVVCRWCWMFFVYNLCRKSQTQVRILWVMPESSISACLCPKNIIELLLPTALRLFYVPGLLLSLMYIFIADAYFFCAFLGVRINLSSRNRHFYHTDLTTVGCQLVSTPGKMKVNVLTCFFLFAF